MLVVFKKYQIFIFLLLVLGLLVLIKLAVKPGPAKPIPSPLPKILFSPIPEAPATLEYSLEGALPEFPQKASVYKIVTTPIISLDEARILAASFGLSGEPKTSQDIKKGSFYSWATEEKYISIGGNPPIVSFSLTSFSEISTSAAVLPTKIAAETAQKILVERGLAKPSIDFASPKFTYFQVLGGNLKETKDIDVSQVIKVSYNYQLDSLLFVDSTPASPPISVFLGPGSELLRLIYTKYPEDFEKIQEITLLSGQKAWDHLKNQKGTIVHLLSEEDVNLEIPPAYSLASAKIDKAFLAYYYSPSETQVLPIFVFEGETTDQIGKVVKIAVYLSATPEP